MIDVGRKLQRVIESQIGRSDVYSLVAALESTDHRIAFAGAAGVSEPRSGQQMTVDTPYFIGSVSKMYTAAIIMMLHQTRQIELGAPISRYLAGEMIRGINVSDGRDRSAEIRVVDLLAQTSGVADYEMGRPRGARSVMDRLKAGEDWSITTEEAVEIVRQLPARFAPATPGKAHYSNLNYRLLGEIIEAITGRSMSANLAERICEPLGLQSTYAFDFQGPRRGNPPAILYLKRRPANVPMYLSSDIATGNVVSTARESMLFLRAFFEGGLFDAHLLGDMMQWNRMFFPMRYGYGLMLFQLPRFFWPTSLPEFAGHSGSTGAFAFLCASRSLYLIGTINQVASPARPFFLMINLVRAAT
jgi:D-alanyl-D-alanine carboxypeptidase